MEGSTDELLAVRAVGQSEVDVIREPSRSALHDMILSGVPIRKPCSVEEFSQTSAWQYRYHQLTVRTSSN